MRGQNDARNDAARARGEGTTRDRYDLPTLELAFDRPSERQVLRRYNESQVFQTGNSRNGSSAQQPPEQYHKATVGNCEICFKERTAVGWIIFNLCQRRCGRDNNVAADTRDVINRLGRSSIKKSATENSLPIRGGHQIIGALSARSQLRNPGSVLDNQKRQEASFPVTT